MTHKTLILGGLSVLGMMTACNNTANKDAQSADKQQADSNQAPNVLIILADDMGYSDIACFGSEVKTPNLDRMAEEGLRMTQFYNSARSCPSRAALLTGLYPHQAGMGGMADQHLSIESYAGYLSQQSVTIAEALKPAGYKSYMSGKWHVGDAKHVWPCNRGFDRSFVFLNGASSYYNIEPYRDSTWQHGRILTILQDSSKYTPPKEGFYMTDAFTDHALTFLKEHPKDQPFFMYLAYTAPHWPLHAPEEDIAKYEGRYDIGWDSLRAERLERMKKLGIVAQDAQLSERYEGVKAWTDLPDDKKTQYAREMAVYAAMIDRMDQNIGRVIAQLESMGELDNTLIIFMSDNGGCRADGVGHSDHLDKSGPIGSPQSFEAYGPGWANASNTPLRYFKAMVHEGGIASPCVVRYPKLITANSINESVGHIIDLMPTVLELAGATYPQTHKGQTIKPMAGKSLLPVFKGEVVKRETPLFWEHYDNKAVRIGDWKLVMKRESPQWELYNMIEDPIESRDMTDSLPQKTDSLLNLYQRWAKENDVLPNDSLKYFKLK